MARGHWELKTNMWNEDNDDYVELNETDLEHIAESIINGFTSGELIHED